MHAATSRNLHREFQSDYRLLSASSGPEARTTLNALHTRSEPLALVLASSGGGVKERQREDVIPASVAYSQPSCCA